MTKISARVGRLQIITSIEDEPPLGWRWWTLAGFPGDPVAPRPYGGTRCLALTMIDIEGQGRWLCAMECDHTFQLFCSHDLFPCADLIGADLFAREILVRSAEQPRLF